MGRPSNGPSNDRWAPKRKLTPLLNGGSQVGVISLEVSTVTSTHGRSDVLAR